MNTAANKLKNIVKLKRIVENFKNKNKTAPNKDSFITLQLYVRAKSVITHRLCHEQEGCRNHNRRKTT